MRANARTILPFSSMDLIKPNVTLLIFDDDDNDCTMYNVMIKNDKYLLKLLAIEVFWGWDDFRITAFPD